MAAEREPASFGDLRGWIDALRAVDEYQEVEAEVDWNVELGTAMRLAQGAGDGPALMFNNIKDYNGPDLRCWRVFGRSAPVANTGHTTIGRQGIHQSLCYATIFLRASRCTRGSYSATTTSMAFCPSTPPPSCS